LPAPSIQGNLTCPTASTRSTSQSVCARNSAYCRRHPGGYLRTLLQRPARPRTQSLSRGLRRFAKPAARARNGRSAALAPPILQATQRVWLPGPGTICNISYSAHHPSQRLYQDGRITSRSEAQLSRARFVIAIAITPQVSCALPSMRSPTQVLTIYNGVDLANSSAIGRPKKRMILSVGRLVEKKDSRICSGHAGF